MSLVAMIARADDRGLATTGLACLDRCVPLLGGGDETLRPLWASVAEGDGWPERMDAARAALRPALGAVGAAGGRRAPVGGLAHGGGPQPPDDYAPDRWAAGEQARVLVLGMLSSAPDTLPGDLAVGARATVVLTAEGLGAPGAAEIAEAPELRPLHVWADACSVAALRIHALLDAVTGAPAAVAAYREGHTDGITPLAAAELRNQTEILNLLAEHGAGALRQALEVSTEGRRILRAAVSRRARAR